MSNSLDPNRSGSERNESIAGPSEPRASSGKHTNVIGMKMEHRVCSICMEGVVIPDDATVCIRCTAHFHNICINSWLEHGKIYPNCNLIISKQDPQRDPEDTLDPLNVPATEPLEASDTLEDLQTVLLHGHVRRTVGIFERLQVASMDPINDLRLAEMAGTLTLDEAVAFSNTSRADDDIDLNSDPEHHDTVQNSDTAADSVYGHSTGQGDDFFETED